MRARTHILVEGVTLSMTKGHDKVKTPTYEDWKDYKKTEEVIDGFVWWIYRNKDGVVFQRRKIRSLDYVPPPRKPNATDDMTKYHREYYRNVRRLREKRTARGFYKGTRED